MPNRPSDPTPPDKGDFSKLNQSVSGLNNTMERYTTTRKSAPIPEEEKIRVHTLSSAINSLNRSIKASGAQMVSATKSVARASGSMAKQTAGKVGQELYVDKKAQSGRVGLSAMGPVGAILAQSVMETEAGKAIAAAAKAKMRTAGSKTLAALKSMKSKKKPQDIDMLLSEKGEARTRYHKTEPMLSKKSTSRALTASTKPTGLGSVYSGSVINKKMASKRSPDVITAVDRLRISNLQSARSTASADPAEIKKEIPKAQEGGIVSKTGAALVHAGESIIPKTTSEKQISLLSDLYSVQEQQLSALEALKLSFEDPKAAGGFFKSMTGGIKMMFPIFGGGMYKQDIEKSSNPLITIASGILEQYRWQRLYGELTKNQLNELIKLQGGTQYDVYGKRGVFFEFLEKNRRKLLSKLDKYIESKKQKGKGVGLANALRTVVDWTAIDPEKLAIKWRQQAVTAAEKVFLKEGPKGLKAIKSLSLMGLGADPKKGIIPGALPGKRKPTKATEALGISEEIQQIAKDVTKIQKSVKASGATKEIQQIANDVTKIRKYIESEAKTKGIKIGDWKGKAKEIITEAGQKLIPSRKDVVSAAEEAKDKTTTLLGNIHDTLKSSQTIQKVQAATAGASESVLSKIHSFERKRDAREEKQEAQEKAKAKRASLWDKIKGTPKALKKGFSGLFDFIMKHPMLVGGAIALLLASTTKLGRSIISGVLNFVMKHPKLSAFIALLTSIFKGKIVSGMLKGIGWLVKTGFPKLITLAKSIPALISKLPLIMNNVMIGLKTFGAAAARIAAPIYLAIQAFKALRLIFSKEARDKTRKDFEGAAEEARKAKGLRKVGAYAKLGLKGITNAPGAVYTAGANIADTAKAIKSSRRAKSGIKDWQKTKKEMTQTIEKRKKRGTISDSEIKGLQRLFVKYRDPLDRKLIKQMSSKDATAAEIENMLKTKELEKKVGEERKRAEKLNSLIKIYGKNNVLPLMNQIKDVYEVAKILKSGDRLIRKDIEGVEYAKLLRDYPDKRDEIVALIKKGVPPQDIRKTYGKTIVEKIKAAIGPKKEELEKRKKELQSGVEKQQKKIEEAKASNTLSEAGKQLMIRDAKRRMSKMQKESSEISEKLKNFEEAKKGTKLEFGMPTSSLGKMEEELRHRKTTGGAAEELRKKGIAVSGESFKDRLDARLGKPEKKTAVEKTTNVAAVGESFKGSLKKPEKKTAAEKATDVAEMVARRQAGWTGEKAEDVMARKRKLEKMTPEERKEFFEKERVSFGKGFDWSGKAYAIITKSGKVIELSPDDYVVAKKQKSMASKYNDARQTKMLSKKPESLMGKFSKGAKIVGKKLISGIPFIGGMTGLGSKIASVLSGDKKEATAAPTQLDKRQSDKAKEIAVQEEINRVNGAVKASQKMENTLKESSKATENALNSMVYNINNVSNNNINQTSNGGGNAKSSLFWKDIDSILAGNNI